MNILVMLLTFGLGFISQYFLYRYSKSINYEYNWKYQWFSNIVTGIFFYTLWLIYGFSLKFWIYSASTTLLINIAIIDSFYLEIPDEHNIMLAILGIIYALFGPHNLITAIIAGFIGGAIYLIMAIVSNGGMGGGDIKLAAGTGIILGLQNTLLGVYYSFLFAIVGLVRALHKALEIKKQTKGKLKLQSEMPFGPFMVAAILSIFLQIG